MPQAERSQSTGAPTRVEGAQRPTREGVQHGARAGERPRRVPQRTCVACRRVEGKRQLVRVVRTPGGTVEVDPTGRKNGRGAYVHAEASCWDAALKRKALQHALKTELSDADRAGLEAYRASLATPAAAVDPGREEGDEQI